MPYVPRPLPLPGPNAPVGVGEWSRVALAAFLLLVVGAATAITVVTRDPRAVIALPALLAGAIACSHAPTMAVLGTFALTGLVGSLTAFTPIPVNQATDFLLASLWLGVIWSYLRGSVERRPWLWPSLLAALLYIVITAFQIPFSEVMANGAADFRISAWYMLAMVLIAIAPWPPKTMDRIAAGFVVIASLLGAYCLFRWLAGSASAETDAARAANPDVPFNQPLRFFGSFLSAQQLGAWGAAAIPFCLGAAIGWQGRWRLLAVAAAAVWSVVVIAADVRTGIGAAVCGIVFLLVLYQFSRGPAVTKLALGLTAAFASILVGVLGYALAVEGDPETEERFGNILTPSEDLTYQRRLERWEVAIDAIEDKPLGHGLGTSGEIGETRREFGPVAVPNIDSSFLKIGLQQGLFVMVYFALVLVALLLGLAVRAIRLPDPASTGLALGAAGVLAAMIVLFYAGLFVEGLSALVGWLLVGLGLAQFSRPGPAATQYP